MQALRPAWVVLDGKRWLFDEASWELGDWFVIKNATGLGRMAFINGLLEEDPAALQALIWFLRRRDEPELLLSEVSFRPASLEYEEVEPAPTVPPSSGGDDASAAPPKTSESEGTTTSPPSPVLTATPAGMSTP